MARAVSTSSTYRLVAERQVNFWNYASQLQTFSKKVHTKLYGCFKDGGGGNTGTYSGDSPYGSVFNLEFSPVEDTAIAVCANRAILVYDPRTSSKVHVVPHAHENCVNCVTFLDNFSFATCSDDQTIRLWDIRNLISNTGVLRGHKNWVKNIEYDKKTGILFSIAFFDGVRAWDLNKLDLYSSEETDNLVLSVPDPVRVKLSPDSSKMFVSMRKNKCLVIDNFDGNSLGEIKSSVEKVMGTPLDRKLMKELKKRRINKPSVHILSGMRGAFSFRAVMSIAFHPSGNFVGLRHIDVRDESLLQELTTLYDIRNEDKEYTPVLGIDKTQQKFLKYVDESSPLEALEYIKEICFSRDGRILASPFEGGVHLLAIDRACTPMDLFYDERFHSPEKTFRCLEFQEVKVCHSRDHGAPVLTCKFANNDLLLGTGCLQGRVSFHRPQL